MNIVIDDRLCNGCETCVRVCPQRILRVTSGNKAEVVDEARCMGCFGCEDECPTGAVRLYRSSGQGAPEVEPCSAWAGSCDVAVIGAGPAGLGAAITCARSGLETVVFERLPNRTLSHHPDGGLLYGLPGICTVRSQGDRIEFPELDIGVPAAYPGRRPDRYGLIGPDGLATDHRFPPGLNRGVVTDKDHLIQGLVREAEQSGAVVRYGSKVAGIVKDGEAVTGLKLADGTTVPAKVVVAADGIQGRTSQKAGIPNNKAVSAHIALLSCEFENRSDLPRGLLYINGGFTWEPDMPPTMAGIGVSGRIEIIFAFMSERRFYPAPHPLDYYLKKFLALDPRAKAILGTALEGQPPQRLNGCRALLRTTNRDIVRDGLVSIGDAFVAGGELGNTGALAHGVHTGRVIGRAFAADDFSQRALAPAAEFISDRLDRSTTQNGRFKTLPMHLSDQEMRAFFEVMRSVNYPTMLLGSNLQKNWMFTKVMLKNALRFLKKPELLRIMSG